MHLYRRTTIRTIQLQKFLTLRLQRRLTFHNRPSSFLTQQNALSSLPPRRLVQRESQRANINNSASSMDRTPFDTSEIDWLTPNTEILRDFNIKHRHRKWGFVLVRCTYSSKEDWDCFLSISKERAKKYLQSRNSLDLWETMAWTVIEDEENLEDADIIASNEAFVKWVRENGSKELERTEFALFPERWSWFPRYDFYVHVDSLTVQNVVFDHAQGVEIIDSLPFLFDNRTRNSLLVVDSGTLVINKEFWEPLVMEHRKKGEQVDWEVINDEDVYMKRVKGCNMFSLYVNLMAPGGFQGSFIMYGELENRGERNEGDSGDTKERLYCCAL